jgi:uncharacterized protein YdgA (DUF945 family)
LKKLSAPAIAAVVVGALVVAYPAASWYTGKRIESTFSDMSQQSLKYPYLKITKQEFKRGIFSSTEEVVVEFTPSMFDKSADAEAADGAPADGAANPPQKPLQLHFVSHIQHGPFPGTRFGSATINTELVLDDEEKAAAEKLFGKQSPLKIVSKLGYMGGGSVVATSPAFSSTMGDKGDKIDWKGITVNADFSSGARDVQYKLDVPGLNAHTAEGMDVVIGAIAGNADMQRVAAESSLYLGKLHLTVDQLKVNNANEPAKSFELQKMALDSDSNAKNNFVDMVIQLGAKSLATSKLTVNDIHYDYGLRHLDEPTLIKLTDAFNRPQKDQPQTAEDATANIAKVWKEFGPALLNNKPEITIDRVSFSTADGEAKLTARAGMGDAVTEDLNNYMALLPKLEASASISIPEAMVTKLMAASVSDPIQQVQMEDGAKQQIAAFEAQGFLSRKGNILSTNFDWKKGKALINGKPM